MFFISTSVSLIDFKLIINKFVLFSEPYFAEMHDADYNLNLEFMEINSKKFKLS